MQRGFHHRGTLAGTAVVSTVVVIGFATASANAQRQPPSASKPKPVAATTSSSSTTVAPTTTTVAPTTTTVAPAPTTTSVPGVDARKFAGNWNHHGAGITINADGTGHASWRTYEWCSDDPTPPCDRIEGNYIYNGGAANVRIVSVRGNQATAVVLDSSDPVGWPDGETTLTLISDHGLRVSTFTFTDFCGDGHWTIERCGA